MAILKISEMQVYLIRDEADLNQNAIAQLVKYSDIKMSIISMEKAIEIAENFSTDLSIFIFFKFIGKGFEKLENLKAKIYGPSILKDYIKNNLEILNYDYPVYNRKLSNLQICFCGLDLSKSMHLSKLIKMMEGVVVKNLTLSVNVLLTSDIKSEKYFEAKENSIPVLLPSWIDKIWEDQSDLHPFSDTYLESYRIPIFYNLKISLYGFNMDEKQAVTKLITDNGATCSNGLIDNSVTHLVVAQTSTFNNFEWTNKYKLKLVKESWLNHSIRKGYCSETGKFEIVDERIFYDYINNSNQFANCAISFIGWNAEFVKKWTEIIFECKGTVVSPQAANCTHVVVGCHQNQQFTENVLCVTKTWLEKSTETGVRQPEKEYFLEMTLDDEVNLNDLFDDGDDDVTDVANADNNNNKIIIMMIIIMIIIIIIIMLMIVSVTILGIV